MHDVSGVISAKSVRTAGHYLPRKAHPGRLADWQPSGAAAAPTWQQGAVLFLAGGCKIGDIARAALVLTHFEHGYIV
jgi:hypothetical protein